MSHSLLIILPCFNEEPILEYTMNKMNKLINQMIDNKLISSNSNLLFIDDGSSDKTWDLITKASSVNSNKGIKLSKNFGHQNAILSGLLSNINKYDLYITIDADLQDDIEIIPKMIESYIKGNEIVYGVRKERENDTFFKRKTADIFYSIQKKLGIDIVYNHADFRLISNRTLIELEKFKEVNLFLRAIFPLIGFKSSTVYYSRKERTAGVSKYPFMKMIAFASDGITSFSIKPLRIVLFVGLFIFFASICISIWILYGTIIEGKTVPGWASTVLPIYFIGGVQLFSIGIIGEYIGKIYNETKARPRFIIEDSV